MQRSLPAVVCCPGCRGGLGVVAGGGGAELVEGALGCTGCGRRFEIADGLGILGDRGDLHQAADWWEEPFTQEHLRRQIANGPELYRRFDRHRGVVDAAAKVEGLWASLGLEVVSSLRSETRRGKANPEDGIPLDEADEWYDVAYVLRKM